MTSRRGRRSVAARVGIRALSYMIRPMRSAFAIAAIVVIAVGITASGQAPAAAEGYGGQAAVGQRSPVNADEFDQLFQQVKNWGRWGADDQLGTVNLITEAKRKQAIKLARTGLTVSLVHNPLLDKAEDNALPFEHTMNTGFTTDTYRVPYHGYSHSHLDALGHILYKNQTYNGYAREVVNTAKGCTRLGIDNLKQGVITRGVLIDIPRLKGVPYLEPGTP